MKCPGLTHSSVCHTDFLLKDAVYTASFFNWDRNTRSAQEKLCADLCLSVDRAEGDRDRGELAVQSLLRCDRLLTGAGLY